MMMILIGMFAASLLTVSSLGQDVPTASSEGNVVITAEQNKKNKRVCKRSVTTGSLMPKVTCRTLGEWDAEAVRNESAKERMRGDQRWAEAAASEKALSGI